MIIIELSNNLFFFKTHNIVSITGLSYPCKKKQSFLGRKGAFCETCLESDKGPLTLTKPAYFFTF